jgi:ABC-type uncharacterized transport system substrate-binding protein
MWFVPRRLALGIVLITAASGVLLISDVKHTGGKPRIAILLHASVPVLEDCVSGMIAGLAEKGLRDGETAQITLYNAQGDMTTANAIAREITDGRYDLVLTSSTPSMQAVANANQAGRTIHVFGAVADAYAAGVGLDRADPLKHPRHLVGQNSLLPVSEPMRLARRMLPGLKIIGVAWNPAEDNSRLFTSKAREACAELGLTLIEAQVENTPAVVEAIHSLIGRGAQAVWVGGDSTVNSAMDTILAITRQARIPVFTINPAKPDRGTLFDIGLDFFAAGRQAGLLAADILEGADPATIPIREITEVVPTLFYINQRVLKGLKENWSVPEDLLSRANVVVDDQGSHENSKPRRP